MPGIFRFKKNKSHNCKSCKSKRKTNKTNPLANCIWCERCSLSLLQREFSRWSSGNKEVDDFIRFQQIKCKQPSNLIEWIPYDRFSNVEYVAQGGFSKVYSATWLDGLIQGWNLGQKRWNRTGETKVVLKVLENSLNISSEFLEEIYLNLQRGSKYIAKCFGFTKEPKSKNYAMVIEYSEHGNLRNYLNENKKSINWYQKIEILEQIGRQLCTLHEKQIVHKNFHIGNVMYNHSLITICDLGIYQPVGASSFINTSPSEIYGVLPYMAPEVLRKEPRGKASDIYAFGGIIYEIITGRPPFYDRPHDFQLALDICNGVHPTIPENFPKSIANLLKRCWELDPKKRITAIEIYSMIRCCFIYEDEGKISPRLMKEIEECESIQQVNSSDQPKIHPEAIYTSRLLSFPNLE